MGNLNGRRVYFAFVSQTEKPNGVVPVTYEAFLYVPGEQIWDRVYQLTTTEAPRTIGGWGAHENYFLTRGGGLCPWLPAIAADDIQVMIDGVWSDADPGNSNVMFESWCFAESPTYTVTMINPNKTWEVTSPPLGPYVADFLLAPNGPLEGPDGNGEPIRQLAAGEIPSITTLSTCFGAMYCGTFTVTPPLLLAARKWHKENVEEALPEVPSEGTQTVYWYNKEGLYFRVTTGTSAAGYTDATSNGYVWRGNCQIFYAIGDHEYDVHWVGYPGSSVCGLGYAGGFDFWGPAGADEAWAGFRGVGGENPSAAPTQEEANLWVQQEIAAGNWETRVKVAIDGAIRPAENGRDLQELGITGNPSFF